MKPKLKSRWKHECSDCVLIAQTDECDIYQCFDGLVTFRRGEGKDYAVNTGLEDVLAAARAQKRIRKVHAK